MKVGKVQFEGKTTIGPFMSTSILVFHGGVVKPVGSVVAPCISYSHPLLIKYDEQRELISEIAKSDLGKENKITLKIPQMVRGSAISNYPIKPILEVISPKVTISVSRPKKNESRFYNEDGKVIYYKGLSSFPWQRKDDLDGLVNKLASELGGG